MDHPHLPFSSLPLRRDGPHGNAWGRFGDADELGTLNLLTPERVKAAALEVVTGKRVSTDWPLDRISKPMFGRSQVSHHIKHKTPRTVNDDTLTFNTQISSQWDGFRHYGYQAERLYYNGRDHEQVFGSKVNGIHVWAENGGIVGRGILLDYAAWAENQGHDLRSFKTTSITAATLDKVAAAQKVTFQKGDILLIRSGWTRDYERLSEEEASALAKVSSPLAIGIESSEATLHWIWERQFAAVAGDMPSLEAWPCQDERYWLHEWLLAGWGTPIGELFDLEELSIECKAAGKWSFLFSSVPLKMPGGVASPPNGVAIL